MEIIALVYRGSWRGGGGEWYKRKIPPNLRFWLKIKTEMSRVFLISLWADTEIAKV